MAVTTLERANSQKTPAAPLQKEPTAVEKLLAQNFQAIKSCLPKHLTPERMCRIAVQTIQTTPALKDCDVASLVACIIEASSLGLEIDGRGLAYIVPFAKSGSKNGKASLIFGYKGLMELAYRSGRVSNIYAETVCENDEFIFELGLSPKLEHKPNLDHRGEIRAVYAVARMKDADPIFVVLGKGDIEKVKKASKSSQGPNSSWVTWEGEMWKKTAIRRLCKYLPLTPEIAQAVALDEQADAGVRQQMIYGSSIDLPDDTFIDVESKPVLSRETVEKRKKAAIQRRKENLPVEDQNVQNAAPAESEDPIQEEQEEVPVRYICPKIGADGKQKTVPASECEECKDRPGCPVHDTEEWIPPKRDGMAALTDTEDAHHCGRFDTWVTDSQCKEECPHIKNCQDYWPQ